MSPAHGEGAQDIAAVLQGRMPRAVVNKEVLAKVKLAEPVRA